MQKKKVAENLYIYTRDNGGQSYVFRGTVNGKRIERGLGVVGKIGIREAKRKAVEILASAPAEEKAKTAVTFGDAWEEAIEDIEKLRRWKNAASYNGWRFSIRAYALPVLKDKPLSAITREDCLAVLEGLWYSKPAAGRYVRQRLEAILDWAVVHGYRDGQNPAVWRGNLALFLPLSSKVRATKHREAPTIAELRAAVRLLRTKNTAASRALLWVIANACRVSEGAQAESGEVNGDIWTINPEHQKTKIYQRIPLSTLAKEALRGAGEGLLFPGTRSGKPVTRVRLRALFVSLCPRLEGQPPVTVHGIRSTFRDWCADNGVADAVAERCLSHQWGNSVTRAYYRNDLFEQRKAVMQAWADALTK